MARSWKWAGSWAGGRIREGKRGKVWVIEKDGQTISLKVRTEQEAMAELALFNRAPEDYVKKDEEVIPRLDEDSIARFCAFKEAEGCSKTHVEYICRAYLTDWLELFKGKDVRRFTLAQIKRFAELNFPKGKKGTNYPKRIMALKSFTAWLREEECTLNRNEDSTLDLKVPQADAEKDIREKGYKVDHVAKVYSWINAWTAGTRSSDAQSIRDTIRICSMTALHLSEVDRLARGKIGDRVVGKIERIEGQAPIAGYFAVIHKNGHEHKVAVSQATLEAGLRLQKRGKIPELSYIHKCLDHAARLAKVETIEPGTLRHSFSNWASGDAGPVSIHFVNGQGASQALIAQVMGHSPKTNKKHYRSAIEPLIMIPLKLSHPHDPPIGQVEAQPARQQAQRANKAN